jgi:hypothetical protein
MNPETLKLNAVRTNLSAARWNKQTQKYSCDECRDEEVDIIIGIDMVAQEPVAGVIDGGVTGYENFYVKDLLTRDADKDMCWCAGTPGRWDSLRMNAIETRKLHEWLKQLL